MNLNHSNVYESLEFPALGEDTAPQKEEIKHSPIPRVKKPSQRERRAADDQRKLDGLDGSTLSEHQQLVEGCFELSYHDTRSNDDRWHMSNQRSMAMRTLSNRDTTKRNLEKTRMCKAVGRNEPCPHGPTCRFAHSIDELQMSDCLFGDECRYVRLVNGKLCNDPTVGFCGHKHKAETRDEFINRVVRPHRPSLGEGPSRAGKGDSPRLRLDIPQQPNPWTTSKTTTPPLPPPPEVNTNHFQTIPKRAEVCHETVLRVPLKLAIPAMELALQSGKRNIRVEVVELQIE